MLISKSYKNRLQSLSGIISENSSVNELDVDAVSLPKSYVKSSLNPQIWDGNTLRPEIKERILKIAKIYIKKLKLKSEPKAIRFLGSMANFNWNEASDLDIHIFYDLKDISDDTDFAKEYLEAKGKEWKEEHNITIKGFNVELYAQSLEDNYYSSGAYDLLKDEWITEPEKKEIAIDKKLLAIKIADWATKIEDIINNSEDANKQFSKAKALKDRIKKMRQVALEEGGEYSIENLVFKYLRNNGYLDKLKNVMTKSFDKELSLDEDIDPKHIRTVIFKNKRNPDAKIVVKITPDGRIQSIENNANVNFMFKEGQILNRNHETWTCNNNFMVNDKDTCPEEKIFGIRKKDIPMGHELRRMYLGKFLEENENSEKETETKIKEAAKKADIDLSKYDIKEVIAGFNEELEHGTKAGKKLNITDNDPVETLKIALAHLDKTKDYYSKLKTIESEEETQKDKKYMNENTEKTLIKHKLIIKNSVDNMTPEKIELVKKFIIDCCKELGIEQGCTVYLTGERDGVHITTTASYNPGNDEIWVYVNNRPMLGDPLRSVAHEIRHFKQKIDNELDDKSGETGSKQENEANSFSGIMIRLFGKKHPEIYL